MATTTAACCAGCAVGGPCASARPVAAAAGPATATQLHPVQTVGSFANTNKTIGQHLVERKKAREAAAAAAEYEATRAAANIEITPLVLHTRGFVSGVEYTATAKSNTTEDVTMELEGVPVDAAVVPPNDVWAYSRTLASVPGRTLTFIPDHKVYSNYRVKCSFTPNLAVKKTRVLSLSERVSKPPQHNGFTPGLIVVIVFMCLAVVAFVISIVVDATQNRRAHSIGKSLRRLRENFMSRD